MATYDPVSTATALAENYVYARQLQLDNNNSDAQSKLSAVTSLKSSLTTFTSAISSLSSKGGVVQQTTSVTGAGMTASAASTAPTGTYTFQVKELATAQQSLFDLRDLNLVDAPSAATETKSTDAEDGVKVELPVQPKFVVSMGDGGFVSVDLQGADENGDGKLSVTEVARAINAAAEGKVSAAVMTVDGEQKLLLSSAKTGKENGFSVYMLKAADLVVPEGKTEKDAIKTVIDADAKAEASAKALKDIAGEEGADAEALAQAEAQALADKEAAKTAPKPIASRMLAQAGDATIVIGGTATSEGVKVDKLSSNSYSGIDGLTVNFNAVTTDPVKVTVAKDESSTLSNMQSFVTAYNTLVTAIDKLTASGNAEAGTAAGAMAGDAGVRSLRNQLNTLMRSTIDGESLTSYGISAQRDGTLALDAEKFKKKVATNPEAIDKLLGKTASLEYQRTGVLGKLQTYVNSWTSSTGGLLQNRQDNLQKIQKQYTKEQATIERLYEQAYQRYLTQFSTLSNLESQMSSTSSMLTSMFSSSSDD